MFSAFAHAYAGTAKGPALAKVLSAFVTDHIPTVVRAVSESRRETARRQLALVQEELDGVKDRLVRAQEEAESLQHRVAALSESEMRLKGDKARLESEVRANVVASFVASCWPPCCVVFVLCFLGAMCCVDLSLSSSCVVSLCDDGSWTVHLHVLRRWRAPSKSFRASEFACQPKLRSWSNKWQRRQQRCEGC